MEPKILSIAITMWLAALAAIVLMRILDGSIRTDGLLCERPGGDVSPERVQLADRDAFGCGNICR